MKKFKNLLFLLFSYGIRIGLGYIGDESDCFSLKGSITCPAFSSFYISLAGNSAEYPFLNNVTNITTFDEAMMEYASSSSLYLADLGCTYKKQSFDTVIPYARYSLSYLCAILIQESDSSLPCNYQYDLNPPPLCQTTCFGYTQSVKEYTSNNTALCPNAAQQSVQLLNLNSTCEYWAGLNGTINCIIGQANEPENCGFGQHSFACSYCRTHSEIDNCCDEVKNCPKRINTGITLAIVLSSIASALLLALLVYWKKKATIKNHIEVGRNKRSTQQIKNYSLIQHGDKTQYDDFSMASQNPLVSTTQLHQTLNQLTLIPQPISIESFYEVKHPYPPQMGDELGLHLGDIICVAMDFDDGWALGFNVTTGSKGVFPFVCVSPVPEELMEQLLQSTDTTHHKSTIEEQDIQEFCDSIRRSLSNSSKRTTQVSELTHHESIPRRKTSLLRSYTEDQVSDSSQVYEYNNVRHNLSHPEHNLPSGEVIEMSRKANRVSKLEA